MFSKEPAKENILFNNPKVVLTPHIAASTTEASIVVAEMVANQLSDFLLNGVKINTVFSEKISNNNFYFSSSFYTSIFR